MLLLAILPIAVALDFGGVLWWTQCVAGLVIAAAFAFSLPTITTWSSYHRPRHMLVMVPLVLWLGFSAFQTIRLSPSIVGLLSPASKVAYTDWISPILPAEQLPSSYPISIAPDDSNHAVALFSVMVLLAWTSLRVFNTRSRLIGLLSAVAITGALISVLGITSLTLPDLAIAKYFSEAGNANFASFVNRNNAALTLNLGLAASLGLLGWRLSALTGQEIDGDEFEIGELFALASDRDSAVGVVCAVLCLAGLLVCGSRGGLGAAVIATTVSFGWMRRRKGLSTIPVAMAVIGIATAILLIPLKLNLESIKRLELLSTNSKTLATDGRLQHWPEGWEAAISHLPTGSGLSTYAYAYLPYQTETPKNWFLHADNLWLELFVEQGIVGITMAFLLLAVLIWCLTTISLTHDALDHGVRITGWYCITAVVFSQFFDFGLIVPANLILFVMLMAAMVSRSSETEELFTLEEDLERPSTWSRIVNSEKLARLASIVSPVVALVALTLTATSIPRLLNDAAVSTAIRTTEMQLAAGQGDTAMLEGIRLQAQNTTEPMLVSQIKTLGQINHRLARLEEVEEQDPATVQQANEMYVATSPTYRRLLGHNASQYIDGLPPTVESSSPTGIASGYREAVNLYLQSLARLPLDPEIRGRLIALDFAMTPAFTPAKPAGDTDAETSVTRHLLTQLGQLHRGHPYQLRDVAALAAQSRMNDLAAEYWKRSLLNSPGWTSNVMQQLSKYKQVDLLAALPDTPAIMRIATSEILASQNASAYPLLETLQSKLQCDDCESTDEKSNCLALSARALLRVNRIDEAARYFAKAIAIKPTNANLRLDLVSALRELGKRSEALQEARKGRQIDPSDLRFDNVIKQMADLELNLEPSVKPISN
ncbi:O-antigen ligase family protein [Rubripirellula reticaptiva]|uniref:O-antigen ligase family protein n=1 Tax=Rubripirellula reticaptiva TaxID=2528013 RepID=UPI001C98AD07|nr:O-antigen ligase family protein [Rubripirellula reticaptiva]